MSSNDESTVERAFRTVTPEYFGHENREMDTIGWGILLAMVVLLVPLLPFLLIVWVISKLTGWGARRTQR